MAWEYNIGFWKLEMIDLLKWVILHNYLSFPEGSIKKHCFTVNPRWAQVFFRRGHEKSKPWWSHISGLDSANFMLLIVLSINVILDTCHQWRTPRLEIPEQDGGWIGDVSFSHAWLSVILIGEMMRRGNIFLDSESWGWRICIECKPHFSVCWWDIVILHQNSAWSNVIISICHLVVLAIEHRWANQSLWN